MTKYDPFSFGQVNLGGKPAGGGAPTPDDMLFADAGPVKQAPAPADNSWSLLDESVDALLPGGAAPAADAIEFGADILGEVGPELAQPAPVAKPARTEPRVAPRPAAPVTKAKPVAAKAAANSVPTPKPPAGAGARAPGVSIQATEAAARAAASAASQSIRRSAPVLPTRRGGGVASLLVPMAVLAGGGTAASWFYLMQQNPVMAGIAGLLSLVGAAFTWLSLRG
jgi:hypothetical protein